VIQNFQRKEEWITSHKWTSFIFQWLNEKG
jgi:hypothetical protein